MNSNNPILKSIQDECDKKFSKTGTSKSQRDSWIISQLIDKMREQRERDKAAQLPLLDEIKALRIERDEWKEKCIKLQSNGT